MSLRTKLAEFGFESNDDYDHALRCLFGQQQAHLRVLHVDGTAGRRKTAFAKRWAVRWTIRMSCTTTSAPRKRRRQRNRSFSMTAVWACRNRRRRDSSGS